MGETYVNNTNCKVKSKYKCHTFEFFQKVETRNLTFQFTLAIPLMLQLCLRTRKPEQERGKRAGGPHRKCLCFREELEINPARGTLNLSGLLSRYKD